MDIQFLHIYISKKEFPEEQAGKRPAIVLSDSAYNARIGLCIACPITSKKKGYPFEVDIQGKRISGVVLSDQVKSLDWHQRNIGFVEKASKSAIDTVVDNIQLP
jgi:mRNA interferase MazF